MYISFVAFSVDLVSCSWQRVKCRTVCRLNCEPSVIGTLGLLDSAVTLSQLGFADGTSQWDVGGRQLL